jgi:sugar (pentulose or hexulose) kinase
MIKNKIRTGNTFLGIELGSTRIKASLIDDTYTPIASGSFEWENSFEDGYWTYSLESIHKGIQACFQNLSEKIYKEFDVRLEKVGAIGVSAMMHGYLAFDKDDNLLVPFRTWRNTTTEEAADKLTEAFQFNIPRRSALLYSLLPSCWHA